LEAQVDHTMRQLFVALVVWPLMVATFAPFVVMWDAILFALEKTTRLRPPWSIHFAAILSFPATYILCELFRVGLVEGLAATAAEPSLQSLSFQFVIFVRLCPFALLQAIGTSCLILFLSMCLLLVWFWLTLIQYPVMLVCVTVLGLAFA
jgi:hypothetical protein